MTRLRFVAVACIVAVALPSRAFAQPVQGASAPVSRAVRANGVIRVDGHLDDAAWRSAPVTDEFTQLDPSEGQPASQRTEVRIVYDNDALYVGVRLHDTGLVTGRLGRRDMDLGDSDWFLVMLDSYHDHRTAFGFDVNPAGVRRDESKTASGDNNAWDAVWDVATSVDSAGWTAEYRIPFSQLRFSREKDQTWGLQFQRVIGRRGEFSVSTFVPKKSSGGVPMFGHLEGLRDIGAGRRLELLPYTVSRAEYVNPGANPYRGKQEYFAAGGLDVSYRMASNLTLNATLNPDFGQVEVDPAVVNLGVYETFFQEKRPFFLEGGEIFDFGLGNTSGGQMFYSRRIGRAPTISPPTALADLPTQTTILGAAKVTGKVAGWSVGSLTALTAREETRLKTVGGRDSTMTAEPMAQYFVGRARRELRGGQSVLGGMVTAVSRNLNDAPSRASLRSSALAGGLDFKHEFGNRTWLIRGDAEFSRVAGDSTSIIAVQRASNHFFQRPDAAHLDVDSTKTSLFGYSTSLSVQKQAGLHWRGEVAGALTSPGYEVNDLGFAVRTDRRDAQVRVTYVENQPGQLFRRWYLNSAVRSEHNYAGEPILSMATASLYLQTNNFWTIQPNLQRQFRSIDDRLTRGGPIATRPGQTTVTMFASSDPRLSVTGWTHLFYQRSESKGWGQGFAFGVGLKSSTWWNLSIGPSLNRYSIAEQFVTRATDATYTPTYGVRYVFAPLRQTELGIETRFNATFTPKLSLETYVQPLISSGDYASAMQLVAPKTFDFTPYGGAVPNLDFNLRSLRGNAVLRWEWREGSTLYAAWQQSRSDVAPLGDFSFSRDRNALIGTRPDNIFLVKVNYWLNP